MDGRLFHPFATLRHIVLELAGGYRALTLRSFLATFVWDVFAYRWMRASKTRSYNRRRRVKTRGGTTIQYRRNRGDIQSIREVWLERVYQVPFEQKPEIVVDLGANIGLTTLFFCEEYSPKRVVVVEPDPGNAEVLRANAVQRQSTIDIIVAAVGDADGTALFAESEESNLGHVSDSGRPVECLSMPSLMKKTGLSRIDLLKIDIEGGEGGLLSVANGWLDQVGSIMIEFHPHVVDEATLVALLQSKGFRYFAHTDPARFGKSDYFQRPDWPGLQTLSAAAHTQVPEQ